jgi:hypothetical protein
MKKLLFLVVLLSLSYSAKAQLGANVKYNYNDAPEWNKIVSHDLDNEVTVFQNAFEYGLDYWIGMEYVRVEFFPEFSYSKSETEIIGLVEDVRNYKQQAISFTANTHIYIFNFSIDRPCPTNQFLNFMQKGWFIQLSPGVSYFMNDYDIDGEVVKGNNIALKLGAGVGFDVRLGDAVIITPFFKFNYYPGAKFEGLLEAHPLDPLDGYTNDSKITQKQIGIRIGFVPRILMKNSRY